MYVDTGSLLFLARLNRLELLEIGVDRVLVPPAVLIEIHRKEGPVLEIIRACYGDWLGECMINNLEILRLKSIVCIITRVRVKPGPKNFSAKEQVVLAKIFGDARYLALVTSGQVAQAGWVELSRRVINRRHGDLLKIYRFLTEINKYFIGILQLYEMVITKRTRLFSAGAFLFRGNLSRHLHMFWGDWIEIS